MAATTIGWTDEVWNPVTGCTRASAGCDNCYAVRQSFRNEAMGNERYAGLTTLNGRNVRHFNGVVRCHEDRLAMPLKWRKPRKVFVNSMSDLFHKEVPFEFVAKVVDVARRCPHITFQCLTKRAERLVQYCEWWKGEFEARRVHSGQAFPSNWWQGVSIEDQVQHDLRMPALLSIAPSLMPVAFVSFEPLLGPIEPHLRSWPLVRGVSTEPMRLVKRTLDWSIIGGESGPKARSMHLEWAMDLLEACQEAGTAVFVKQLGRSPLEINVFGELVPWPVSDGHGKNLEEFPEGLRVREFPEVRLV